MAAKRLNEFSEKPFLLRKQARMVFCHGFVAITQLGELWQGYK
jgi:hypothetical protein